MQVVKDVFVLAKPRIVLLLAITSMAGYMVATRGNADLFSWPAFLWSTLGLCLSAAGANSINMWWDRDIDRLMQRTKKRPLPQKRLSPSFVLVWGIFLGVVSTALLWGLVNFTAALMALAGYLFYIFIYTIWLKRRTVQNIVIGGAAGAFPPLVGWAAVQDSVADPLPWLMFAIIFLWTPPHFWALALLANKDYTKAKIPMLPVVKGVAETKVQIISYLLVLIPVTLAVGFLSPFGFLYLSSAAILGGFWLWLGTRLLSASNRERVNPVLTRRFFTFSLYYLAFLFSSMVLEVWT
jgi:protoheme IX farnesyltransferase